MSCGTCEDGGLVVDAAGGEVVADVARSVARGEEALDLQVAHLQLVALRDLPVQGPDAVVPAVDAEPRDELDELLVPPCVVPTTNETLILRTNT